ncbi:hypothetical protein KPL47_14610 [Clostridium estertheticum]|uniref:hypothetical protein n=1 Tax=Clostridium estertheticum TaxID=238834 RepID=UPI001C0D826A|nr:hypothetical protein [Clostridium estertheticum]MBU3177565.1 hypothetical protein [Clostridium estertheticum]
MVMVLKLDGNKQRISDEIMTVVTCQSVINEIDRLYELKYELSSCRWILFKI